MARWPDSALFFIGWGVYVVSLSCARPDVGTHFPSGYGYRYGFTFLQFDMGTTGD